ncbi:hypothetical protein KSP40_PGU017163 [Platanthera guangdongensis]|uniref:FCP1 homology domain-containing protein n=1 Tax=Platanthera guangdongensis TaxID=2320717 RepID=A0ABR2LUB3_9ASPA
MPAFKMKIKSKTNFVREYNRKSAKISKGSRPQIKLLDKQTTLDSSNPSPWKVSCKVEASTQNIEIIEANECQDTHAGDSTQLLKSFSTSDSTSFGGIESMMATSPDNLETIFSHGFEQNDEQLKVSNDTVGADQPQLPHLVADEVDDEICTLSGFQPCNAIDFYFSDIFTALPDDGIIEFNDIINISCPDYEIVSSNAMLDMEERPILLPFLDECMENMDSNGDISIGKHKVDSDDSCLQGDDLHFIHQLKLPDQGAQIRCFSSDIAETACFIHLTSKVSNLTSFPPLLQADAGKGKPNTLVLDLDETLVHSRLEHCDDADFSFPVFFNMKQHTVYVRRRPHLQMFLEKVAQMFRVVIFTASESIYAERLLNILDPDRMLISECFYRESCVFSDGSYTKDLTILGVDLAKVVIVDNSPQVFRLQVDNGIPIKSWFDDPADQALKSLLPFLESLAYTDDVRPLISGAFGNR